MEAAYNCIVIVGPTASGKTRLACELAYFLNGEIISADSRQVYRGLDIGTGKDPASYFVNGRKIHSYLIDVADPMEDFYLHNFIEELDKSFSAIEKKEMLPIVCGGTGLYLDVLHKDFSLTQIPEDQLLREKLSNCSKEKLIALLDVYDPTHTKHVDKNSSKRLIRGIEVAQFLSKHQLPTITKKSRYHPYYIGINISPEERRKKIETRLALRMQEGLIEEVTALVAAGVSHQRLQRLGLEYKFVSLFLLEVLTKDQMRAQLNTAINQFAKRQMTWFRKMEKEGIKINWISPETDTQKLSSELKKILFHTNG